MGPLGFLGNLEMPLQAFFQTYSLINTLSNLLPPWVLTPQDWNEQNSVDFFGRQIYSADHIQNLEF